MNLTWDQWRWLLAIVPAWAALLLGLWNRIQNRPRRTVEVSTDVPPDAIDFHIEIMKMVGLGGARIYVHFINERGPLVVLEEVGFVSADGTKFQKTRFFHGEDLPQEVAPGYSVRYCFDVEDLRNGFQGKPVPAWAYCRDVIGRCYESRRLSQEIRRALVSR